MTVETDARAPRAGFPQLVGRVGRATKLWWGLLALVVAGILLSPETSSGRNIFLSYGNLFDVFRQVSITGIIAVGMTMVILTAGIDLSVGSILALATVICAMLLTIEGWTAATVMALPCFAAVIFAVVFGLYRLVLSPQAETADGAGRVAPWIAAGVLSAVAVWIIAPVGNTKVGVLGVLLAVPCVGAVLGAVSGLLVTKGRLQPFIVTLAMMVSALGMARLVAGQNMAVHPVYTGSNAPVGFEWFRETIFGFLPVPGLFFAAVLVLGWILLRFTVFGSYIYSIGGNEHATRLAGINVDRVKITVYAISGYLSALAGILYVAQYRQGKPDAGLQLELDAIAAVAIGGTSLMGGRGSIAGTFVGVLIFGLLTNILQLRNIDTNTQLLLKGAIIIAAVLIQERGFSELKLWSRRPR